jgi:acyl-CoA reductase-like NAD-dependent aldehyde dehydrogenase
MAQRKRLEMATTQMTNILNCIAGEWRPDRSTETLDIANPATCEILASVLMAGNQASISPPAAHARASFATQSVAATSASILGSQRP